VSNIQIYHISRGYRKATVWLGGRMTKSRVGVFTCTPFKILNRYGKYQAICRFLQDMKIVCPCYREKDPK